jgi:hypothetical protein
MATDVSICSNALLMLGAQSINDFNENNDRAKLSSNLFPLVRDWLLRRHPWNCAVKRVTLTPDATTPAFDYSYQFSIPSDWLKTLQVGQYGSEVDFRHEGRKIVANDNPLYLRYIFQNTVVGTWDASLVFVATQAMVAKMAYAITKSTSQQQMQEQILVNELRSAGAIDGQDDPADTLGDFRLLAARGGGNWIS